MKPKDQNFFPAPKVIPINGIGNHQQFNVCAESYESMVSRLSLSSVDLIVKSTP